MGRNLFNRSFEVLGIDQRIWLSRETGGYGKEATGGVIPLAAGAVEHITANVIFNIPREDSASRSGRSVVTRLSGKKEVEISMESYIIPGIPDGLGNPTLPPMHPVILSAFGDVDLSNPSEIVYKLSRLNDKSFRILEEASHYSRLATGCVAESITFSLPGDGKATMAVEGFAQDFLVAGESTLAQALTGAAVAASLVLQDLTFDAVASGANGNLISIEYTTGGTAGSEAVTVVGNAISVQIEDGVSTATQVKAAIDGTPAAVALVSVTISGVGGNAQAVVAETNLSGGLGVNQLKVATDSGQRYEVGAYIDILSGVDGDTLIYTDLLITAIGTGVNADIITVDQNLTTAAAISDIVIGHAPESFTPVTSENALLGLKGSVQFAGFPISACEIIMAEISLTNNFTKKDFLYGTSETCGYIPDKRRQVGVKVNILLNKDNFTFYMRNKKFVTEDMTITLEPQDIPAPSFTSGAGRTWEWHFPRVEFNIPPIEQPADGYVQMELEGVALASDINNVDDEMTLTIR